MTKLVEKCKAIYDRLEILYDFCTAQIHSNLWIFYTNYL